jgi:hypothetical protein
MTEWVDFLMKGDCIEVDGVSNVGEIELSLRLLDPQKADLYGRI